MAPCLEGPALGTARAAPAPARTATTATAAMLASRSSSSRAAPRRRRWARTHRRGRQPTWRSSHHHRLRAISFALLRKTPLAQNA
eukprot:6610242-Alexandrium_andersonii.AAC.1